MGLPEGITFISILLDNKTGKRRQTYSIYIEKGLFLPIDYTKKEMEIFYNKFAEGYDKEIKKKNMRAIDFFVKRVKKHIKGGEMLDLGAGTGLVTGKFVKQGFSPATLIDFSEGMLKKARKRKELKNCKFLKKDLRRFNLHKKFDFVLSFFSLGSNTYFSPTEISKTLVLAKKHLKKGGIIAIFGHDFNEKQKKVFKEIDSGVYTLESGYHMNWFIGKKK